MKRFFIISVCLLLSVRYAHAQETPSTAEVLKEAYAVAAKENKQVFVLFHASWCGWCKRMDKSMQDPSCKKFFDDNYIIAHLVVMESKDKKHLENPGAETFLEQHHGKDMGIPFWLIFNKDGKLLADAIMRKENEGPEKGGNSGCPATENEVAHFIKALRATSSLNDTQLEIIRKRFRENDN